MRDRRTAQPDYVLIPIIGRIRGDGEVEFYDRVTERAKAPPHLFRPGSVKVSAPTGQAAAERDAGALEGIEDDSSKAG